MMASEVWRRDWVFQAVLILFVAVVVWFGRTIHDFLLPPSNTITVPSFVGQTLVDASAEIQRLHLTATVVSHGTSDRYPQGVIMNQQPAAGAEVREGRDVSFIVSDGIMSRIMPDLRYQSMREVNLDLLRAHVQTGKVTYVKSDVVPEGHVISQDPAPLSATSEGDKVTLVVSKGGVSALRVPDFVGMPLDDARALAEKDGVKFGQIVWTPLGSAPPHGVVVRQVPGPGTQIRSYDRVSLQVSAGPNESGYILRQVPLLVSVPVLDQDQTNTNQLKVRIAVTDATGTYDLYNAYAEPGQKLNLTVSALGTSVVDMYVNDVLVGTTHLGKEPPKIYDTKAKASPNPGKEKP